MTLPGRQTAEEIPYELADLVETDLIAVIGRLQAELERQQAMFTECVAERDAARLLNELCHF